MGIKKCTMLLALFILCPIVISNPQIAHADVPIPDVIGPIPVTADSYPFLAANRQFKPIDLASYGYIEEEFFLSGTANVYDWDDPYAPATVRTTDASYTNRILVRRPTDPKRFSGNVIVELLNNAYGWDFPFGAWGDSHEYFLSHGDVWVGVTSAPSTVKGLKNFNPVRYAPLSWANPLPPEERCNPSVDTEAGLIWDIASQVGALMKSEGASNPLAGYAVDYVYAAGSTGGELATYINAIHPLATLSSGKPVYDGYVIKSTGRPKAINQCAPRPDSTDPRAISRCTVPVIRLFTTGDILGVGTHSSSSCQFRRPDSDDVYPYRHYEISGAWLGVRYHWLSSPCEADVIAAKGGPFLGPFVVPPHEFPLRYILNGAFANMDLWVRQGTPPPHTEPIEVIDDCSTFVFDEFGNTLGGVRTPYVDVPIVTYPPADNPIPFDHELLKELYGNHGNYVNQVVREVNELVKDRWVTKEDGEKIKTEAAHSEVP
jgi:hypothetical protein